MKPLAIDVECTTNCKGSAFSNNKLVMLGAYDNKNYTLLTSDFSSLHFDTGTTLVGFNIKFDLHHLRKNGINYSDCSVWDCQLAHFILTGQTKPYPSLNDVAEYYGLGSKLDVVSTEYWAKGINTNEIPTDILSDYLKQDLLLTYRIYERQVHDFSTNREIYNLFRLQCKDLICLADMEYNGMPFDKLGAQKRSIELKEELETLDRGVKTFYKLELDTNANMEVVNLDNHYHIEAILFGGEIEEEIRELAGVYKTGQKIGLPRYKINKTIHKYKDHYDHPDGYLLRPLSIFKLFEDESTVKERKLPTDEETLTKIMNKCKGTKKKILELILKRAKLKKRISTYLDGLVELIDERGWNDNVLHGNFNQCVTKTGRLSSSAPNMQNIDEEASVLMTSRFK